MFQRGTPGTDDDDQMDADRRLLGKEGMGVPRDQDAAAVCGKGDEETDDDGETAEDEEDRSMVGPNMAAPQEGRIAGSRPVADLGVFSTPSFAYGIVRDIDTSWARQKYRLCSCCVCPELLHAICFIRTSKFFLRLNVLIFGAT